MGKAVFFRKIIRFTNGLYRGIKISEPELAGAADNDIIKKKQDGKRHMIQDLAPLHFENAYHNIKPEDGDHIISISAGRILLGGENQKIIFPQLADLSKQDQSGGSFIYLFAIGKERFFSWQGHRGGWLSI
ncbi:MAG: hypothetical protein LIO96_09205 [Lachnospiraceae bacterium]|nr:hypothetical protein [Lachnospiraceae bacterium]